MPRAQSQVYFGSEHDKIGLAVQETRRNKIPAALRNAGQGIRQQHLICRPSRVYCGQDCSQSGPGMIIHADRPVGRVLDLQAVARVLRTGLFTEWAWNDHPRGSTCWPRFGTGQGIRQQHLICRPSCVYCGQDCSQSGPGMIIHADRHVGRVLVLSSEYAKQQILQFRNKRRALRRWLRLHASVRACTCQRKREHQNII